MKTKEQIEAMAYSYFENESGAFFDRKEASMYSYQAGYEQAQKDAQEREAKLIECVKFYSNNGGSSWDDLGGKRAREVLKELNYE